MMRRKKGEGSYGYSLISGRYIYIYEVPSK
jgi:hypothetical protein